MPKIKTKTKADPTSLPPSHKVMEGHRRLRGARKIYCYVDETGQDTKGRIFIVAVVVVSNDRDELTKLLNEIEIETGKLATKWSKSKKKHQIAYLEKIFNNKKFQKIAYYSLVKNTRAYRDTTIVTVASAVNMAKTEENYEASVFIDGLKRQEVHIVSVALRRIGVKIDKVRGITDESHSMIRLADAIAGLARRKYQKVDYAKKLYNLGIKKGVLQRL